MYKNNECFEKIKIEYKHIPPKKLKITTVYMNETRSIITTDKIIDVNGNIYNTIKNISKK